MIKCSDTKRNWRRTSFRRLDGSIEVAADDWTLCDDAVRPLARIYRYLYGPQAGAWSWFVLVAPVWDALLRRRRDGRHGLRGTRGIRGPRPCRKR